MQDVQHLDGAVLDVQRTVGIEVEPLVVGPRQDLGDDTGAVQDVDGLVVVEIWRPLIVGLVVWDGVVGAWVQGVGANEQLDLVAEPEGVTASRSLGAVVGGWTMGPRLTLLDGVWAPAVQPTTRQRRATDVTVGAGIGAAEGGPGP